MRAFLLFTMLATACTDETCLDGVCADPAEARTLPGPCAVASNSFLKRCDFTYDAADRPATSVCTVYGGLEDETYRTEAFWVYDATSGALASYEYKSSERDSVIRWSWDADRVLVERLHANAPPELVKLYDRALFAFDPSPTVGQLFPSAMLGLLLDVGGSMTESYAWTRAGNRLTRTGSGGTRNFDLDERGRLISANNGFTTYTYDGDRLASQDNDGQLSDYVYDTGGNISEVEDSFHQKEIYSYDCW